MSSPDGLAPDLVETLHRQRSFFASGATRPVSWRCEHITKLAGCVIEAADQISAAQEADGVRPSSFAGAAGMLRGPMGYYVSKVGEWCETKVLADTMPAERRGGIDCDWLCVKEPKGVILNIAPWNAPALLSVLPCLGALAAGNCCVIKPPDATPRTSALLAELVRGALPPEAVTVVQGGASVCESLIDFGFDHIMFTGGTAIGRLVMARAAQTLTPVTLELGGKNPVMVDAMPDGMLAAAVKEIVGTKRYFSGEFCQCHDLLLVVDPMWDRFLAALEAEIQSLGEDRMVRLIHGRHYQRVKHMLESHRGRCFPPALPADDEGLRLPITAILGPDDQDPIMQDEVFGPLWPVLRVPSLEAAIARANAISTGKPLVSYYYGESMENADAWLARTSSGSLAINAGPMRLQSNFNSAIHGVGNSGLGGASIWGEHVFQTFSHSKHVCRPRGGAFAGSHWGGPKL